jgi:hypothetical protein
MTLLDTYIKIPPKLSCLPMRQAHVTSGRRTIIITEPRGIIHRGHAGNGVGNDAAASLRVPSD